MSDVNKAILVGRLGKDPEIRYTQTGTAAATLVVATSEKWKDRSSGEPRESTEWHRLVCWGRLAEICEQYLHTGDLAYFEGKLTTRKWQGRDGVDRYTTEIQVRALNILVTKARAESREQSSSGAPDPAGGIEDDDIPF